jgi:ferredoxin
VTPNEVYCFGCHRCVAGCGDLMPLDDKEQRILAEIERQFYEEDPELARAVKKIEKPARVGIRLSLLGVIAGLAIVIAYVSYTWVAVAGFTLLVASATSLVNGMRLRGWRSEVDEPDLEQSE